MDTLKQMDTYRTKDKSQGYHQNKRLHTASAKTMTLLKVYNSKLGIAYYTCIQTLQYTWINISFSAIVTIITRKQEIWDYTNILTLISLLK